MNGKNKQYLQDRHFATDQDWIGLDQYWILEYGGGGSARFRLGYPAWVPWDTASRGAKLTTCPLRGCRGACWGGKEPEDAETWLELVE